ncbi:tumor necrosis factor ligand superfamily member 14-like [Mercenaria mercenaria]|uniref:tumor necrosis factor ligand superfamily member 14-like n=1 Tax=Mercenaria mercenaria TaxID=6596 RepID=UPI00234E3B15|nr:tumor necrosis factor ligand superfamily member 14-like [Mercenaria mercenaria]
MSIYINNAISRLSNMADTKSHEKAKMLYEKDNIDAEKHTRKPTKKSTIYVVVGLILLNLVLMTTLITLVVKWRVARQIALEPREQTVCLACQELGLFDEELPEEVKGKISRKRKEKSEELVCCGYTSSVLERMVSEAIKQRGTGVKSSLYPLVSKECNYTTRILPSAQVNGISTTEMENEGVGDIIHWETSDKSFLKGGITYKDGKLTIKEPGYYYVFSQIMLRNVQKTTPNLVTYEENPTHLDHYMHHYSRKDGTTRKILEASKSLCEMPSANDETTSTIGAVFYLEKHDEVFVNTSHPQNLVPSQEGSHFWLYLT